MTVRVLFVCLGNICRSPTAEGVFRHLVDEANLTDQFHIDSAGTGGWHVGEKADDRMRSAANKEGIKLLVAPLNSQDIPGFHIVHTADALRVFEMFDHPNTWLQFDIYHMQIMEGNLTKTVRDHTGRIAHMQLADNPGRHEPGTGEVNFPHLFETLDRLGYDRWVGADYVPSGPTADTLGWFEPYRRTRS